MFGESQPSAPTPNQGGQAPGYSQPPAQTPGYAPGATVQNPALGNLGAQIQLPQGNPQPQPAPQGPQPWQTVPNQVQNPYAPQQQQPVNPYAPMQQPNPYGQVPQPSPFAAPPQGYNQYNTNQVPPGQAAPAQQQLPQQNPAFQFNPYSQQQPVQQPAQQNPLLPGFVQQIAQPPGQPQPPQITAEQLAKQPEGITQEQIQQIFPDPTSQAIFAGMDQISKGTGIDLLTAFGAAYERRDPSLVNERYLAQFDPRTAQVLKGQFQALVQSGQARDAAVEQSVYQMAGGQQQWDAAVQVFNRSADKATVAAVAAAVNSGDQNQLHLAVQTILNAARMGGQMIQRSGQLLTPNGGGQPTQEVMTNERFGQHLDMLAKAHPVGSPQYNQHYQNLVAQRRQAKAAGY